MSPIAQNAAQQQDVETVECAAIKFQGVVFSVPRPGRHPDVIRKICRETGVPNVPGINPQGFVTSTGRFVTREEAMRIAITARQPWRDTGPHEGQTRLFSEDLW